MIITSFSIFLLDVNFDNSTIILHGFITFFMFVKFLDNQKSNSYIINLMFKF